MVCSDVIQKVLIIDEENKLFKLLELLGEFQAKGSCIIFVDKQVSKVTALDCDVLLLLRPPLYHLTPPP